MWRSCSEILVIIDIHYSEYLEKEIEILFHNYTGCHSYYLHDRENNLGAGGAGASKVVTGDRC